MLEMPLKWVSVGDRYNDEDGDNDDDEDDEDALHIYSYYSKLLRVVIDLNFNVINRI